MEEKKRKGKAGYYVIGIFLAVLVVLIIVPAVHHHRSFPIVVCQSHIYLLHACYLDYYMKEGSWPAKANWCDLIKHHLYTKENIRCPKDKIGPCSYAMNENIPDDAKKLPDDMVLLFESSAGWNQVGGLNDVVTDRHKRAGASISFADGHVEFVKPEDIPKLRWTVEED